jgi:site-specific recombinase XerD
LLVNCWSMNFKQRDCMKATCKIILKKSVTKKDGTHAIYLRLTINRFPKTYSLNVSCLKEQWSETRCEVKLSCPESKKINLLIANAKTRAAKIIFDYEVNSKQLTYVDYEREFFAPKFKSNSFYEFVNYSIKENDSVMAKDTLRSHYGHLSKLKAYRADLAFNEVSVHFLDAYRKYMKVTLKNNENTINKSLSFIKVIINRAIHEGALKINPIKEYKLKKITGNRDFLTRDELEELEKVFEKKLTYSQRNVLKYFLFACYTGLRFQDIKDLRYRNINNSMIVLTMHKTKDRVSIPIIEKASVFLMDGFPEQRVFKVYTNQVTNRYLKEVIDDTTIKKKISFHCARHTFATVGFEVGIPIECVSSILGHKDLKTTQIYAKVLDYRKIEEMKKWVF